MKYLCDHRSKVSNRLGTKRKILLLLDFDGTLSPISKSPETVFLSTENKKILSQLIRSDRFRVAIVSGRSLADLERRCHLSGAIYVGNHGLEFSRRMVHLPASVRKAHHLVRFMRVLAEKLKITFGYWHGVWVENKRLTISLHLRNLSRDRVGLFNELLSFFKFKYRRYPVVWRKGKKVWEIRPAVAWDKGKAALYLLKDFPLHYPVVIGDDRTDEDMFRVFRRKGLTIRVGRLKGSAAQFYLKSVKEVTFFLETLCR